MKAAWLKVWRVLRWIVAALLVMFALDPAQDAGSRAVAAVVALGWYVHLQLSALRRRQDDLARELQSRTPGT